MASVLAIISKKIFDKECPGAAPGSLYETSTYTSKNKVFEGLAGGDIYLVTARPGDTLWLVGVLRSPTKKSEGWSAKNATPIIDITALRATIKFESGKGISQAKGALGMSLQTPRALSSDDVRQLEGLIGGPSTGARAPKTKTTKASKNREASKKSAPAKPAAKASADFVQYTPDALKYLYPRTREQIRPRKETTLGVQWKKLAVRTEFYPPDPSVSGEQREAAERAVALMKPGEPGVLEGDDAAILIAAIDHPSRTPCCRYLVARIGLVATLEALIRAHALFVSSEPTRRFGASTSTPLFQSALFEAYLGADAETQRAYEARIEAAYEEADLVERISLVACMRSRYDWGNECAQAYLERPEPGRTSTELAYMVDDPVVAQKLVEYSFWLRADVINIVPGLREHAVPILAQLLETDAEFPSYQQACGRALSCIGTAESAAVLVKHIRKKAIRPHATGFFSRYPHLARGALGELASKKTKLAALARELLENLERAASATAGQLEIADDKEVPEVLRSPPWRTKERAKRKLVSVPDLVVPIAPARLHWPERSRREWNGRHFTKAGVTLSAKRVAEFEDKVASGTWTSFPANLPAELVVRYLTELPNCLSVDESSISRALGFIGAPALEAALHAYEAKGKKPTAEVFMHIDSPAVVPILLAGAGWGSHWLYFGLKWLEKYPDAACAGLVPLALAKKSKTRAMAETWLRYLARFGHTARIKAAAKTHGPKSSQGVDEILATDEREDCPTKPPKMPTFFRPAELRAPRLKSGKALPLWAVERIGEMLKFSQNNVPYIGIDELREACDAESLAHFAWDLAQAWDTNGAKETHQWMLYAVLHFGDDEAVRRLTPALRGEGIGHMLGYIGTDAACMELQTIFARLASAKLKVVPKYAEGAEESLRYIAAHRGTSVQEMADHFVPTLDLDDERGVVLDFGTELVRGCFDEKLKPTLKDNDGNVIRTLPSVSKSDPTKRKLARAKWKELQEDVAALVRYRGFALERAMVEERGWSPEIFRALWVNAPLLSPFARAVVWVAVGKGDAQLKTFRIADDRTFAGADDELWEMSDEVREIRVAHPGDLSAALHKSWSTLLEDYELHSPLGQFRRLPDGSDIGASLTGRVGADLAAARDELHRAGWHGSYLLARALRGGDFIVVRVDGEDITAEAYRDGKALALGELSAAARSETQYVLNLLVQA